MINNAASNQKYVREMQEANKRETSILLQMLDHGPLQVRYPDILQRFLQKVLIMRRTAYGALLCLALSLTSCSDPAPVPSAVETAVSGPVADYLHCVEVCDKETSGWSTPEPAKICIEGCQKLTSECPAE